MSTCSAVALQFIEHSHRCNRPFDAGRQNGFQSVLTSSSGGRGLWGRSSTMSDSPHDVVELPPASEPSSSQRHRLRPQFALSEDSRSHDLIP